MYFEVNAVGELTTKALRVPQRGTEWAIQDRKSDRSWPDVTCKADCRMAVSSEEHIPIFSQLHLSRKSHLQALTFGIANHS